MINQGIVTSRTKGFYYLLTSQGLEIECKVKGQLFKNSRYDNQIAVGDRVSFIKNESDDVGLITGIEERKSFLSRTRVGIEVEQIIAANIDILLIVASAINPPFRVNLVNRLLVAARVGNIEPILVVTKTDLVSPELLDQLLEIYSKLDLEIILSSTKKDFPENRLREILEQNISVLSGQSGVGKSSILKRLYPDLQIRIGSISKKTAKGSHTTTYAQMHKIGKDGYVIDTPGIREFGLWEITRKNLREYYPVIDELGAECKHRNCHHLHEPYCAVKSALEDGEIHKELYSGYLSIYDSLPD